ncbi:hypothetical protein [Streptomyces kronopolitis]|uniref:hypothetical protein n=1 Tax=Streptomyces kronopolitis TaxID=1612435 RepID=UPI00367DCDE0
MHKSVTATIVAVVTASSLAVLPMTANAADTKKDDASYTITTAKGSREATIKLHDAKATKVAGGLEISSTDSGKDLGLLPNDIQKDGVKYTVSYEVNADGTVTIKPVSANPKQATGKVMTRAWDWKCMARTSQGGAVAGGITGLESGPGAIGTAFLGAVGGAAASFWTCK